MSIYICKTCNNHRDADYDDCYGYVPDQTEMVCERCVGDLEGEERGYECMGCRLVWPDSPASSPDGKPLCQECTAPKG